MRSVAAGHRRHGHDDDFPQRTVVQVVIGDDEHSAWLSLDVPTHLIGNYRIEDGPPHLTTARFRRLLSRRRHASPPLLEGHPSTYLPTAATPPDRLPTHQD